MRNLAVSWFSLNEPMENESTVEPLPATTEQSDAGMEGKSLTQAEYAAQEVKKAMAKAKADETPEATTAPTDTTAEGDEAELPAETVTEVAVEGDKPEGDEQPEEQPETDEEPVLSKLDPKTQEKIQKRINKVTARAKTAEDRVAELEAEKANQAAPEPQVVVSEGDPSDKTVKALSESDLAKIEEDARNTVEFIEANDKAITRAIAKDEQTVIIGGREFDVDELRDYGKQAKRHIERYIPARRQWLSRNAESVQQAKAVLPSMFDKANADYQEFASYARKNPAIRNVPDAERLFALAKVGERYLAEQKDKKPATAKASAVAPKTGADTGAASSAAKPRNGGSGEKAKLQGELGQAQKAFERSPTQTNYQQVLILQDRLKKLK